MAYTSDKTLYHDGNGHVGEAGGKGWELLVRKGGQLSDADAARFGLVEPKPRKAKPAATSKAAAQAAQAAQKEGE